jgi:hypothetical protein
MDLFENPFYVLKATPRDRKSRLMELAEDLSFHEDSETATRLRNQLVSPRSRIEAEVAWLPGLSPKRVSTYLMQLAGGEDPYFLDGLAPLAHANLVAASLRSVVSEGEESLYFSLDLLAELIESIDCEQVMLAINEDRLASGIPAVTDVASVEAEVIARRRYFQRMITSLLDELPTATMVSVYERLVAEASLNGEEAAPCLIDDLIDAYELQAGAHLDSEAEKIVEMIEATEQAANSREPPTAIHERVLDIIHKMELWDRVAQPIQLSRKSRGLDHDESVQLALSARSLAIDLYSDHDLVADSELLSGALQSLFCEVTAVSELLDQDVKEFVEIHADRKEDERERQAKFEAAITYETSFGVAFKDKFRLSPDGIEFKGLRTPLDKVSAIRWGAVRHSVNGVPSGTTYHIGYRHPGGYLEIETRVEKKYDAIVSRLWKAVCIGLLREMCGNLANGASVNFGTVEVWDGGVVLARNRFMREDERKFHAWDEVSRSIRNGAIWLVGVADKRFTAEMSFKDTWNTHLLNFALDKIWAGKATRLGNIFDTE